MATTLRAGALGLRSTAIVHGAYPTLKPGRSLQRAPHGQREADSPGTWLQWLDRRARLERASSEVYVTKDRDFKDKVRAVARESDRPYSRVRADLIHREPDDRRWVVVRTYPGAEDQARLALIGRYSDAVFDVLVPRFGGRPFAGGFLVVHIRPGADVAALVQAPCVVDHVGAPGPPRLLEWRDVRTHLVSHARPPTARSPFARLSILERRAHRRQPAGLAGEDEVSRMFRIIQESNQASRRATRSDAAPDTELLELLDESFSARRRLFESHWPAAERLAQREGAEQGIDPRERSEAAFEALSMAIGRYPGWVASPPLESALAWWVRQAIVERTHWSPTRA
ncbi:MAG: hypothetical protein ACRDVW_06115 [Acidimicrobiales bacterium]